MNSAFVTQPNPDDLLLNNGEDQQPRPQGINPSLEHPNLRSEKGSDEKTYAAFERDGGVKTAGNCPSSASEEMGVVNVEHHIPGDIGEGRVEVDHITVNYEQDVSSNVVNISDDRTRELCSKDLLPAIRQNGNAINNHIGCGYTSSNIMNADSLDIESSSSMVPSNSNDQDFSSSDSRSRTLQNDGNGTRTSSTSSSDNENVASTDPDYGTTCSMSNHSRGIETEVIVNQQNNGDRDINQSCPGGERNQEVTNMQISHVGEMTLTSRSSPQEEECAGNNVSDSKSDLQVHISRSTSGSHNSNVTEDDKHDTTCVESESGSPQPRCPPTLELEESTSPATLDVTSSEEWEDASAELTPRPHFFMENLTDLTPSPSSQQTSQSSSSWSSQRTLSVSSTPVEGSSAISGSCEGISETGNVLSSRAPAMASVVPDDKNNTPTRSRTSTATSLSTDFSSNISIATDELNEAIADGLVLGEEDVGFEEVNLEHGEPGHPTGASVVGSGAKPKKRGLGGFLTRNIFRKSLGKSSHSPGAEASPPGWKLFGRVPAKESMQRDHMQISEDFQKRGQTHPPTSSLTWKKRHTGLKEASSTTALILENRPENLPAKNPEEEEKHKEEYTKMLKEAKKKELKLYKQKLKKMAQQLKYEDGIKSSLHVWQNEILPKWDEVKKHKKTRELWWQGIPPSIRGRVWMLAIKNELNITHELFEIFLIRAKDKIKMCSESESEGIGLEEIHAASRENSVDVIKLDVARTFPHLCIFQKGGPYFDLLHGVLGAYACYRPDVGYVQGMSFIAAVFLLYLDVADAFICFANLLNKSCQLAFFRLDQQVMQSYFNAFEEYFQDNLPRLFAHFDELGISPDLYIIDWMYTLYSKSLPLDVACRVWDVFFRDGEELLFRTSLGILSLYEEVLLNMDFIQAAQFLTNIPVTIDSDKLFKHIGSIDMHQKKFGQILMQHLASNLANQSGS